MDFLRRIDKALSDGLQRVVERSLGSDGGAEFLESYASAVDELASHIEQVGDRRLFPFKHVTLTFGIRSQERRAALSQMLASRRVLVDDIRRRLVELGCERPSSLSVEGVVVPADDPLLTGRTYLVKVATELPPPAVLVLTVMRGHSDRRTYAFTQATINIGRQSEVLDGRARLIRRNHVVFADRGTGSVSRLHAHILFDPELWAYRIFDDRSTSGTRLVRGDLVLDVPSGPAGAWLRSGDELHLGEARLTVEIREPTRGLQVRHFDRVGDADGDAPAPTGGDDGLA